MDSGPPSASQLRPVHGLINPDSWLRVRSVTLTSSGPIHGASLPARISINDAKEEIWRRFIPGHFPFFPRWCCPLKNHKGLEGLTGNFAIFTPNCDSFASPHLKQAPVFQHSYRRWILENIWDASRARRFNQTLLTFPRSLRSLNNQLFLKALNSLHWVSNNTPEFTIRPPASQ